jgi:hypothetical protein
MEGMDVEESKAASSSSTNGSSTSRKAGGGASAAAPAGDSNGNVEAPNFDLDLYASRYTGFTKVQRLLFIAQHCK